MNEKPNTDTQLALTEQSELLPFPCVEITRNGDVCGKRFKSLSALRMHKIRSHGRGWDTSGNFKKKRSLANLNRKGGKPWTPEQFKKFAATMKRKARRKQLLREDASLGRKPIQIVYPDPMDEPTPEQLTSTIRFCPHCGTNIEKHL